MEKKKILATMETSLYYRFNERLTSAVVEKLVHSLSFYEWRNQLHFFFRCSYYFECFEKINLKIKTDVR